MQIKSVEVTEYADELISAPRGRLRLTLAQADDGVALTYQGRLLARFRLTPEGMMASGYMAQALGLRIPAVGASVEASVSSAVLFRALSIAELDYANDASFALLERLLEEAEIQRGEPSDA